VQWGQVGAAGYVGGIETRDRWYFDYVDAMYKLDTRRHDTGASITPTPIVSITPVQNALIWVDNRGGHGHYWYFMAGSKFRLKVAINPYIDVTHVYTPVYSPDAGYSYHGTSYIINALKVKLGLNAIQNNTSLLYYGVISNMFSSFTIE